MNSALDVSSVCFVGKKLDVLAITTAQDVTASASQAGDVFTTRVDVSGAKLPVWRPPLWLV